jgi:hypothetical protein
MAETQTKLFEKEDIKLGFERYWDEHNALVCRFAQRVQKRKRSTERDK